MLAPTQRPTRMSCHPAILFSQMPCCFALQGSALQAAVSFQSSMAGANTSCCSCSQAKARSNALHPTASAVSFHSLSVVQGGAMCRYHVIPSVLSASQPASHCPSVVDASVHLFC